MPLHFVFSLHAYALQDIGQRSRQEDAFYPPFIAQRHYKRTSRKEAFYDAKPHIQDQMFIVCDGMGGHESGDVASRTVCQAMSESINAQPSDTRFTDAAMGQAVRDALSALDAVAEEGQKMGTTMALLKFHQDGVTIGHIGDSRVYHFRPAQGTKPARCLFHTEDHSWVNELLHSGQITLQQAISSTHKHLVTRAMMAHATNRVRPDIHHTIDVQTGDMFLLCSDGVLENLDDETLLGLLTDPNRTDEDRVQQLLKLCNDNQDNHTAWIVRVCEAHQETPNAAISVDKSHKSIFSRIRDFLTIN